MRLEFSLSILLTGAFLLALTGSIGEEYNHAAKIYSREDARSLTRKPALEQIYKRKGK